MTLLEFLKTMTPKEREKFALSVGTTARHLANISYGYKPCGESLAINIERESAGSVMCETLRSDVDWQFLRGTAAARRSRRVAV